MKLNLNNLEEIKEKVNSSPSYDVKELREKSVEDPKWITFGAGNIFRGFIARLNQDLLNSGDYDRGISVCESFDREIVEKIYRPYDNLALSVTLNRNGDFDTNLIANLSEGLILEDKEDKDRLEEIFKNKNLQIASFVITEKGYSIFKPSGEEQDIVKEDIANDPKEAKHLMSNAAYLLYVRYKDSQAPITLLSMDNCSHNGEKLRNSVLYIAEKWVENGKMEEGFLDYVKDESKVSFPWSMIDKITPRPAKEVQDYLEDHGFEDMDPVITSKHSYIAPFVNSEEAEYLVIEDRFTNGRPPLEKAGVYMTDRDTVNKVETMKVTTCLNPLHTALAVYGCLLGYESISDEMKDEELVKLVKKIGYQESLPVVVDPKILNPKDFIDEVINVRLPNPYIPDTPQRIATDTSQKISIRFGGTIKSYDKDSDKDVMDLDYIPLALAGWLRYLLGVDDEGNKFERSSDPLMEELDKDLEGISLGNFEETEGLKKLLKNENIFGSDLEELGLSEKVIKYFQEMTEGPGAVRNTLKKYLED